MQEKKNWVFIEKTICSKHIFITNQREFTCITYVLLVKCWSEFTKLHHILIMIMNNLCFWCISGFQKNVIFIRYVMQLHKIDHLYNKINNDIDFIYNI